MTNCLRIVNSRERDRASWCSKSLSGLVGCAGHVGLEEWRKKKLDSLKKQEHTKLEKDQANGVQTLLKKLQFFLFWFLLLSICRFDSAVVIHPVFGHFNSIEDWKKFIMLLRLQRRRRRRRRSWWRKQRWLDSTHNHPTTNQMCSNFWILMRKEKVLLPRLWEKNRVEFFLSLGGIGILSVRWVVLIEA